MPTQIFIEEEKRRRCFPWSYTDHSGARTQAIVAETWDNLQEFHKAKPAEVLNRSFVRLGDHSDLRECADCGRPMSADAPTYSTVEDSEDPSCLVCGVGFLIDSRLEETLDFMTEKIIHRDGVSHHQLMFEWPTSAEKFLFNLSFGYEHPDHPAHDAWQSLMEMALSCVHPSWKDHANLEWSRPGMGWDLVLETARQEGVSVLTMLERQFTTLGEEISRGRDLMVSLQDGEHRCQGNGCHRPLGPDSAIYKPSAEISPFGDGLKGSPVCLSCGTLRITDTIARGACISIAEKPPSFRSYNMTSEERCEVHAKLLAMVDGLWGTEKDWVPTGIWSTEEEV